MLASGELHNGNVIIRPLVDMLRSRLPAASRQSRRTLPELPAQRPATPDLSPSPADLLFNTWPGRLFLVAAALKLARRRPAARDGRARGDRAAQQRRDDRADGLGRLFRLAALPADEAPAAVARAPQADPVLHLHRRRAGAADHRVLHPRRVCDLDQRQRLPVPRRLRRHGQLRRAGGQCRGIGGRTQSCSRRRDGGAGAAECQQRRPAIPPVVDRLRAERRRGTAARAGRRVESCRGAGPHSCMADGSPRRVRRHGRARGRGTRRRRPADRPCRGPGAAEHAPPRLRDRRHSRSTVRSSTASTSPPASRPVW